MAEKRLQPQEIQREEMSRRRFLKFSGGLIVAIGIGYVPPGKAGPAKGTPEGLTLPAAMGYLLVDIKKCQGCLSCMLACSLAQEGVEDLSLSRIQVLQNPFEKWPADIVIGQCRQCVDPACVKACKYGALRANPQQGQIRMIDYGKCVGCGACFEACPYQPSRTVVIADERSGQDLKGRKCDLCAEARYHFDKAGGGPHGTQACVAICPLGAITFSREIPVQEGDSGYYVNLRGPSWQKLGYPIN